MGIGFFFGRCDLFFARKREKHFFLLLRFWVVFLLFFCGDFAYWGVISRFGRCFGAIFFVAFPPAGP